MYQSLPLRLEFETVGRWNDMGKCASSYCLLRLRLEFLFFLSLFWFLGKNKQIKTPSWNYYLRNSIARIYPCFMADWIFWKKQRIAVFSNVNWVNNFITCLLSSNCYFEQLLQELQSLDEKHYCHWVLKPWEFLPHDLEQILKRDWLGEHRALCFGKRPFLGQQRSYQVAAVSVIWGRTSVQSLVEVWVWILSYVMTWCISRFDSKLVHIP